MLKRNLDVLQQVGVEVGEIRSTGGGARSPLWNQIKANVCNRPVITLLNEETALLGDAILAGVASGIFQTIDEGCASMVTVKDKVMHNDQAEAYIKPYQMYCNLDRVLGDYYVRQYGDSRKD